MKNTKSPIKTPPLRNPGQSLDDEIQNVKIDEILEKSLYIFFSLNFMIMEWYRYFTDSPPSPIAFSVLFIIVCIYVTPKIMKGIRKLKRLKLGRDGEKDVGQYLDTLRSDGFEILHDVVGGKFNLDHIIISEHGVYTIETKTYSKPDKGQTIITYKDGNIFKNDFNMGDSSIIQAKAQSSWLKGTLKDLTGDNYDVKPIVVFPGWYVKSPLLTSSPLWVLNPNGIKAFIKDSPITLSSTQKKIVSNALARFVRNSAV